MESRRSRDSTPPPPVSFAAQVIAEDGGPGDHRGVSERFADGRGAPTFLAGSASAPLAGRMRGVTSYGNICQVVFVPR